MRNADVPVILSALDWQDVLVARGQGYDIADSTDLVQPRGTDEGFS